MRERVGRWLGSSSFDEEVAQAAARLKRWEASLRTAHGAASARAALFLLALGVRLYFVLALHPPGDFVFSDMSTYQRIAQNLATRSVGPWDSFAPVGFPVLLMLLGKVRGGYALLGAVQASLGAISVLSAHAIARRVTGSALVASALALILSLYFPLIYYAGFLLSETLFSFALLLAVQLSLRALEARPGLYLGLSGLAWGLAIDTRPNALLALPVVLIVLWRVRPVLSRALPAFALFLCALALPVGAAATFYSHALGRTSLTSSNGGLNFYLNFSEVRGIEYRLSGSDWYYVEPIPNGLSYERVEKTKVPFYEQRFYYRRGFALLCASPRRLLRALDHLAAGTGLGAISYWPGWEQHEGMLRVWNVRFGVLCVIPALFYAAWLAITGQIWPRKDPARCVVVSLLLACLLGLYWFLGDPRLRVPFDPFFLILAGDAASRGLAWFNRSLQSAPSSDQSA
jgi:4-amino-4-deoxy-L-arabinose transferase-like glycosyltransferase